MTEFVPFSYKAIIDHENFVREIISPSDVLLVTKTIVIGDKTYNILGEETRKENKEVYIRFSFTNEAFVKEFEEVKNHFNNDC